MTSVQADGALSPAPEKSCTASLSATHSSAVKFVGGAGTILSVIKTLGLPMLTRCSEKTGLIRLLIDSGHAPSQSFPCL